MEDQLRAAPTPFRGHIQDALMALGMEPYNALKLAQKLPWLPPVGMADAAYSLGQVSQRPTESQINPGQSAEMALLIAGLGPLGSRIPGALRKSLPDDPALSTRGLARKVPFYHGPRDAEHREKIIEEGLTMGRSAEFNVQGASITRSPGFAATYHGRQNPLVTRNNLTPDELWTQGLNMSPAEYAIASARQTLPEKGSVNFAQMMGDTPDETFVRPGLRESIPWEQSSFEAKHLPNVTALAFDTEKRPEAVLAELKNYFNAGATESNLWPQMWRKMTPVIGQLPGETPGVEKLRLAAETTKQQNYNFHTQFENLVREARHNPGEIPLQRKAEVNQAYRDFIAARNKLYSEVEGLREPTQALRKNAMAKKTHAAGYEESLQPVAKFQEPIPPTAPLMGMKEKELGFVELGGFPFQINTSTPWPVYQMAPGYGPKVVFQQSKEGNFMVGGVGWPVFAPKYYASKEQLEKAIKEHLGGGSFADDIMPEANTAFASDPYGESLKTSLWSYLSGPSTAHLTEKKMEKLLEDLQNLGWELDNGAASTAYAAKELKFLAGAYSVPVKKLEAVVKDHFAWAE